jgi:hypothetical protein
VGSCIIIIAAKRFRHHVADFSFFACGVWRVLLVWPRQRWWWWWWCQRTSSKWCCTLKSTTTTTSSATAGSSRTGKPQITFYLSTVQLSFPSPPPLYSRTYLDLRRQLQVFTNRAPRFLQQQERQEPNRSTHPTGKTCRPQSRLRSRPYHSRNPRAPTRPSILILMWHPPTPPLPRPAP